MAVKNRDRVPPPEGTSWSEGIDVSPRIRNMRSWARRGRPGALGMQRVRVFNRVDRKDPAAKCKNK